MRSRQKGLIPRYLPSRPAFPKPNFARNFQSGMRIATQARAKVSPRPLKPLPPNLQVLPPLQLYRRILRAHRKYLPPKARLLGDSYVKEEFHRTKNIDNPVHIIGFLTQWQVWSPFTLYSLQEYCQQVEGKHWKDGKVDIDLLEKMTDEQLGQVAPRSIFVPNDRCMNS